MRMGDFSSTQKELDAQLVEYKKTAAPDSVARIQSILIVLKIKTGEYSEAEKLADDWCQTVHLL